MKERNDVVVSPFFFILDYIVVGEVSSRCLKDHKSPDMMAAAIG